MATSNPSCVWPGSMWLPDPGTPPEKLRQQTLEMMSFINDIPGGMLKCKNDSQYTILRINDGFLKLIGYTREELSSQFSDSYINLIHPDDRQRIRELTNRQLLQNNALSNEYRVLCKDGSCRWVTENAYIAAGNNQAFFCTLTDITGLYETREALRLSLERHDIILRQSKNIVFEWDKATNSLLFSANWADLFGYPPLPALDFNLIRQRKHIAPEDVALLCDMLEEITKGAHSLSRECRLYNGDGAPIWCRIQVTSQFGRDGALLKAVGIIANIDAEKKMIDSLRQKAERDPLTGLYDKSAIRHLIEKYLGDADPSEQCALLMIDIDNFKSLNDTLGHLFGDAVLSDLSSAIRRGTRSSDLVGRIGGDEFLVFLKGIPSPNTALQKSEQILSAAQNLFQEKKNKLSVSCSIGIALFPAHGHDFHNLYQGADIALYQAKSKGKNAACLYSAQMQQPRPEMQQANSPIDSGENSAVLAHRLTEYVFQVLYRAADIETAIPLILEVVGRQFDVSRAYVFENSEDGAFCSNTFEWCSEGIRPEKEHLQNLSYSALGGYPEHFDENDVFFCREIQDMPESQRVLLQEQGIHSMLQCAIRYNGMFAGFVGFDECTGQRLWTQEEIAILTRISELLSTFLFQKRIQQRGELHLQQIRKLLDQQDAFLYVIDRTDYRLLYFNNPIRHLHPGSQTGERCYRTFFRRDTPCEDCPALEKAGPGEKCDQMGGSQTSASARPLAWEGADAMLISRYDIARYKEIPTSK
ncbi:MAG: diguanylate cyclase [Oscillospiraceae bacterium]|nr:diguanylate cyclase [Oscillospiraceae bacterium]